MAMRDGESARTAGTRRVRDGRAEDAERIVAAEAPVAMTFNRVTHAVMMATPADLADFALGFALAEGIVDVPAELEEFETVAAGEGAFECRMWIGAARMQRLERRRRRLAGVTGCGMCGLESLAEAQRPPPPVPAGRDYGSEDVARAVAALRPAQALNAATRAVHGAAFWTPEEGLVAIREDVGRHNALDKLAGALARRGRAAASGLVVMTSRISVELVQKAAAMGAPVLVAVSAPTTLALRTAEICGMTLVGVARDDGFEVFTGGARIRDPGA